MSTKTQTLRSLSKLRMEADLIRIQLRKDGEDWKRSWRAQRRWERRFQAPVELALEELRSEILTQVGTEEDLARMGMRARQQKNFLRKAEPRPFDAEEFAGRIAGQLDLDALAAGAVNYYMGIALQAGEEAGQFTLDALGLGRTFEWANPRSMANAIYATRGSKVIQSMHGTHINELAEIVGRATDPLRPMSVQEVAREIREKWAGLTRHQAAVIARTETAAVWQTTSLNAMAANGVGKFDSLIASGPSIGVHTEPVCPICLEWAANGPWQLGNMVEHPPLHPSCRCVLVPTDDWLPPDEPWTGGDLENLIPTPDF
jgi:hypothetical protein